MGIAYEVLQGSVGSPGTTVTDLVARSGDSFTVRSFPFESGAFLEGVWAKSSTRGLIRVRSPRLHDNVQGIRLQYQTATPQNLLPDEAEQRLFPQDVLVVSATGAAAAEAAGALTVYYRDLPGTDARLAMWEQVKPRVVNILTAEVAIGSITTAGRWSDGTALDATFDLLKANVDYAVLGYVTALERLSIALRGPDTGNLRVGGPGPTSPLETRNWFVDQSRIKGTPHIPIINAANKGATLAFQGDDTAAAAVDVGFILAELS